jgi:hypothetical protein
MTRVFVLGNGPSLKYTPFDLLEKERTFAVNHIWKLWEDDPRITWRPTDYVRCEYHIAKEGAARDALRMLNCGCTVWLQEEIKIDSPEIRRIPHCDGTESHPWHLPTICIRGTVINAAMQIAVLEGAAEIYLVGCDLGTGHFYNGGFPGVDRALEGHRFSAQSCPIPVFDATLGGALKVYPRVSLENLL